MPDRYGADVLASDWREPPRGRTVDLEAELDLVVEDATTGFCGAIVATERDLGTLVLEDRHGKRRTFPLGPGFLLEGKPVSLLAPRRATSSAPTRTASGSRPVANAPARVARASRIYVEGRHDAELVEKIWGDDLRVEGVVVEHLGGADDLAAHVREFSPGPGRRLGVLLDHMVAGSKETRLAESVKAEPDVLVVGHPYIDVWQSVRPERVGIDTWPHIPHGTDWKHGVCEALGWPHANQADIARAWQFILSRATSFADLEPSFLGRVEELIDFVAVDTSI